MIEKIDITAKKIWVGGPAQKPAIHFQLYRNGEAYGEKVLLQGVTSYTWKGLDKTDVEGKPYTYTVKEVTVPNSYTVSYNQDGLTVTNTWNKKELPSTGVGSNMALILLGLGLLGATGALFLKRKEE